MRAGNSFHRIKFYAKVITRDAYGASSDTWPIATISTRGEVRYTGGYKTLANEEKFYAKSVELIVKFQADIVETMKIQIDGTSDLWSITFMEILGRFESIRLTIEKCADGLPSVATLPPTSLVVTSSSATSIGLVWVNNASNDAVSIERSTDGSTWSEIHKTATSTTTYSNTGLTTGTRYFYRVRAFAYHNYSTYSNVDDATPTDGEVLYETESTLLFNRMTTQPSTALKTLINTTIAGLKADGVWSLADCMYIRGVHTSQAACLNWINSKHESTLINNPTFTPKQGFTGNGANSYIDNNYNQSTGAVNYTTSSSSIVVMSGILGTQNARSLLGVLQGAGVKYNMIYFYTAGNEIAYINDATGNANVSITAGGYLGYTKTNTTVQGYLDGSPSGAAITSNNRSVNTISQYELAINSDATPSYLYNGQIGFSFYGGYLTPTQMLALYTRIKYFYDNVGGTF